MNLSISLEFGKLPFILHVTDMIHIPGDPGFISYTSNSEPPTPDEFYVGDGYVEFDGTEDDPDYIKLTEEMKLKGLDLFDTLCDENHDVIYDKLLEYRKSEEVIDYDK